MFGCHKDHSNTAVAMRSSRRKGAFASRLKHGATHNLERSGRPALDPRHRTLRSPAAYRRRRNVQWDGRVRENPPISPVIVSQGAVMTNNPEGYHMAERPMDSATFASY